MLRVEFAGVHWILLVLVIIAGFSLQRLILRRSVTIATCGLGAAIGGILATFAFFENKSEVNELFAVVRLWAWCLAKIGLQNIVNAFIPFIADYYFELVLVGAMSLGAAAAFLIGRRVRKVESNRAD